MRPLTVLILALGGEGGGVLADWVVDTAIAEGWPVQATSVPGVAQRTGSTSYYIELLPVPLAELGGRTPVFCLSPTPGEIDLLISSELLETARALERGMPDPKRTLLVSSDARMLTVAEKMQMGDGRYDGERIVAAARSLVREAVIFDMAAQAHAAGTVISSVMFGALAATGVLPLARAACERTIGQSGAAAASLDGFRRGFEVVANARCAVGAAGADAAPHDASASRPTPQAIGGRSADAGAAGSAEAPDPAGAQAPSWPAPVAPVARLGAQRTADFQDAAYARLYAQRLERIVAAERAAGGGEFAVSSTAARFMALWMAYEDAIRVADLKTRPERFARIRSESQALPHEPVVVSEFLRPGVDEIAAILPRWLARRLRTWGLRHGVNALSSGIRVRTSSAHGYFALRLLAWLRPLRRRSDRFAREQHDIERWLAALLRAIPADLALAREIAECPRLIKGYGETLARGRASLQAIMETLVEPALAGRGGGDPASAIRRAREAALADPEGQALAGALGRPPPPIIAQPIRFMPRAARRR